MEDDASKLVSKVQELGDVELAVLLCFIAGEHCIIEADPQDIDNAERDVQLVCMISSNFAK